MLIEFKVKNFRSVKDEVVFDLRLGAEFGSDAVVVPALRNQPVSLVSALYGANASGKSNILRAMYALEYFVTRSSEFKPDMTLFPYEPHRLDEDTLKAPVTLEIVFMVDEIRYDFSLTYNHNTILEERLDYYPQGNRKELYYRLGDPPIHFGDSYRGAKKALERLLLPNQLFLSKAAQNNVEMLLPAYRFFALGFSVFPYISDYKRSSMTLLFARRLAEQPDSLFSRRFNALICALDTGISEIKVEESDWDDKSITGSISLEEKEKMKEFYKYKVFSRHPLWKNDVQVGSTIFQFQDESVGTRRLLVVAGLILQALENGSTLVLDEFENSLHTHIGAYLIELFKNPTTNPNHAQLIIATHDITLLSNERFRRDQIWITEKQLNGATELFRVSDIRGIRKNIPLDKWYQAGTLGGTPIINDLEFQFLFQNEEATAEST